MKISKITEAVVSGTQVAAGTKVELRDQQVKGFIVEKTGAGRITFALRTRQGIRQRCIKIGQHPTMSVADARARAIKLKAELELGNDVYQTRQDQKAALTLRSFFEQHYIEYVKTRKRSWKDDSNRYWQHIDVRFGERKLNTLTRKEIVDFHSELRALGLAPATCDRFLSLFRYMLNLALQWGFITSNPAAKVSLYLVPNELHVLLSNDQLSRLLAVLQAYHNRPVARLFLFLLSTGARLNEAMTATWEQIDLEQANWVIPASTAKANRVRAVPLNSTAITVLNDQQPDVAKRVGRIFVKDKTGKPIKSVDRAWASLRNQAGLPRLRIHDCRHVFASTLISAGRTLFEVQQVLGHSSPNVTQRYAHLSTATLQAAVATAANRIDAAMPKFLPAPTSSAS